MSINQDFVYVVLMNYVNADQMFIDYRLVGIYSDLQKAEAAEHEYAQMYRQFDDMTELGLVQRHLTWEEVNGGESILGAYMNQFTSILKQPLQ